MKKVINMTGDNKSISEIAVLDYFKVDKNEFLLYEKQGYGEENKVYLAKLEDGLLVEPGKDAEKVQAVVKALINGRDKKELSKHHYKALSMDKLPVNVNDKKSKLISLSSEQYNNLIAVEPVQIKETSKQPKEKKPLNKKVLLIAVLAVLVVGIVLLLVLPKNGGGNTPGGDKDNKEYKLTFETNSDYLIGEVTVKEGETFDLTTITPVREGYNFQGWYTDSNLIDKAGTTLTVNKDIKLYARWKPEETCTGICNVGQKVTLIDGSVWYTVKSSTKDDSTITLLASGCNTSLAFDDSNSCQKDGKCSNKYSQSNIKSYLEKEELNNYSKLKKHVKEIRLLTKEEYETLATVDTTGAWLYNAMVCPYGNWWTSTPYGDKQVYMVNSKGLAAPEDSNGNVVKYNGVVNTKAGVRAVIVVDKAAIKK